MFVVYRLATIQVDGKYMALARIITALGASHLMHDEIKVEIEIQIFLLLFSIKSKLARFSCLPAFINRQGCST